MKFCKFLEINYAQKSIKQQMDNLAKKDYDLKLDAQIKAASEMVQLQRRWFKFIACWMYVFAFFLAQITRRFPVEPIKEQKAPVDTKPGEASNVVPLQQPEVQKTPK